jgi:hypothetical protein
MDLTSEVWPEGETDERSGAPSGMKFESQALTHTMNDI